MKMRLEGSRGTRLRWVVGRGLASPLSILQLSHSSGAARGAPAKRAADAEPVAELGLYDPWGQRGPLWGGVSAYGIRASVTMNNPVRRVQVLTARARFVSTSGGEWRVGMVWGASWAVAGL